jgi:copper chaperone CopZ
MKSVGPLFFISLIISLLIFVADCADDPAELAKLSCLTGPGYILPVTGVSCDKCSGKIQSALKDIPGIKSVEVLDQKYLVIGFAKEWPNFQEIKEKLESIGHKIIDSNI